MSRGRVAVFSLFAVVVRGAALLLAAGRSTLTTLAVREAHAYPGWRFVMREGHLRVAPVLLATRGRP